MNKSEFTSYCREHINPEESGLMYPSGEDIERWTKHGYFRHAPQYNKDDIHLVFAILRNEQDLQTGEARGANSHPGNIPSPESEVASRRTAASDNESGKLKRQIVNRFTSTEFQEMVRLARKTLTLPEKGFSPERTITFLFSASLAAWCNYCWSLEAFQRKFLALESEEERIAFLRPVFGEHAPLLAKYTMPEPQRAQFIDWLLCAKLLTARLSTFLGLDNGSDMMMFLLCPELRPLKSWQLKPVTRADDPAERQFSRFISAILPVSEETLANRTFKKTIQASVRLAFDVTRENTNWDQMRAAYQNLFPFDEIDFPDALRMRTKRAVENLPYTELFKFTMAFFNGTLTEDRPVQSESVSNKKPPDG